MDTTIVMKPMTHNLKDTNEIAINFKIHEIKISKKLCIKYD